MKEKKLVYEGPELKMYYFIDADVITLSGSESGSMEEDEFENMGLSL